MAIINILNLVLKLFVIYNDLDIIEVHYKQESPF